MKTQAQEPTAIHHAFRADVLALLKKYTGDRNLSAEEMLALAAHLVGQIIAMQDQSKMTPALVIELVGKNIEAGNAEVLAELQTTKERPR